MECVSNVVCASNEVNAKLGEGDVNIFAVAVGASGADIGASGLFGLRLRAIVLNHATLNHSILDTILGSVATLVGVGANLLATRGRFFNLNAEDSVFNHLRAQLNV